MNVVPFEFSNAKFQHSGLDGFWVTLFFLFDGKSTFTFRHQHDLLDNVALCYECGVRPTTFTHKFLVTKDTYPDIYNEIKDYVLKSNLNR